MSRESSPPAGRLKRFGSMVAQLNRRGSSMHRVQETVHITPTLFGDALGNQGDYSTGMFYACRRKFLTNDVDKRGVIKGLLRPPTDFMTVRQKRNHVRITKEGISMNFKNLDFKKANETEDYIPPRPHYVRNDPIVIQKYPSLNPRHWREMHEAGCTFYVHKTGEVAKEKPWEGVSRSRANSDYYDDDYYDEEDDGYSHNSGGGMYQGRDRGTSFDDHSYDEEEEALGTGSLAYDDREVRELFDVLDKVALHSKHTEEEHA